MKDPKNPQKQKEDRELVKFTGPTDSVYLKARDYVELDVGTGKQSLQLLTQSITVCTCQVQLWGSA